MGIRSAAAAVCDAAIVSAAPVKSGASADMPAYPLTHPDVNDFSAGLHGMPKVRVRQQTGDCLNASPTARADLGAVRAPSRDFRVRRNLPQRALTLADNL